MYIMAKWLSILQIKELLCNGTPMIMCINDNWVKYYLDTPSGKFIERFSDEDFSDGKIMKMCSTPDKFIEEIEMHLRHGVPLKVVGW